MNQSIFDIMYSKYKITKPIRLIEDFLKISSKEEDVILDPFAGSGTTAIACIKTNRNFIGIEKDEGYFNLANERINKELNNLRLNI